MRRVVLVIEGEPQSKAFDERPNTSPARFPRVSRGMLCEAIGVACAGEAFTGCVAVGLVFYRSTFQRIDLDNLSKRVLDAATGVAWEDDSQVTSLVVRKRHDRTRPRTIIGLADDAQAQHKFSSAVLRQAVCPTCGGAFLYRGYPRENGRSVQTYCSRDCATRRVCERCGQGYTRNSNVQRYCAECGPAIKRERQRRSAHKRRKKEFVYA